MGKWILTALVIVIMILAALVYFEDTYTDVEPDKEDIAYRLRHLDSVTGSDADNATKTLQNVEVAASRNVSEEQAGADTPKGLEEIEEVEKAPVTFGYITHGDKIQIVGLMSHHDETGALKGYIDRLCQERDCSVEIDYQDNILDAPWQKSIVELFGLMQSDDFTKGAFFIEAGHITLEGQVEDEWMKKRVVDILDRLHKEGLEIAPSALVDSLHTATTQEQNSTAMRIVQSTVKETNQIDIEQNSTEIEQIAKDMETKNSAETEQNSTESQIAAENIIVPVPLKSADTNLSSEKEQPSPKPEQMQSKREEIIPAHIVKPKEPKHRPKVVRKSHKNKRVKARKKYHKDIIAPSYMETTIDLERKIKSRIGIKGSRKDDMIAEPKMTIMK